MATKRYSISSLVQNVAIFTIVNVIFSFSPVLGEEKFCYVEMQWAKEFHLNCKYNIDNKTFILDCNKQEPIEVIDSTEVNKTKCNDYFNRGKAICSLDLKMDKAYEIYFGEVHKTCTVDMKIDLVHFEKYSPDFKGQLIYGFENKSNLNELSIAQSSFATTQSNNSDVKLGELLTATGGLAQSVSLSGVTMKSPFARSDLDLQTMTRLQRFSIKDSHLFGLDEGAISLHDVLNIEMTGVTIRDNLLKNESIQLSFGLRGNCKRFEGPNSNEIFIRFDFNFFRQKQATRPIIIDYRCTSDIQLDLTITNVDNVRVVPRRSLAPLLNDIMQTKLIKLVFNFEQIDCCLEDNKWLFDELVLVRESESVFNVNCFDLGSNVTSFKDREQLNDACKRRNVYPIFIISTISIVVLTLLLIALSCICIFYVLPKSKGSTVMIETRPLKSLASSASGNKTNDRVNKNSSAIELMSTETTFPSAIKSKAVTKRASKVDMFKLPTVRRPKALKMRLDSPVEPSAIKMVGSKSPPIKSPSSAAKSIKSIKSPIKSPPGSRLRQDSADAMTERSSLRTMSTVAAPSTKTPPSGSDIKSPTSAKTSVTPKSELKQTIKEVRKSLETAESPKDNGPRSKASTTNQSDRMSSVFKTTS